jgi:hypothetical protein
MEFLSGGPKQKRVLFTNLGHLRNHQKCLDGAISKQRYCFSALVSSQHDRWQLFQASLFSWGMQSTLQPTSQPTPEPIPQPMPKPTPLLTPDLMLEPTAEPTAQATPVPTLDPTPAPTPELTPEPTSKLTWNR